MKKSRDENDLFISRFENHSPTAEKDIPSRGRVYGNKFVEAKRPFFIFFFFHIFLIFVKFTRINRSVKRASICQITAWHALQDTVEDISPRDL